MIVDRKEVAMAMVEIADAHIPRLVRLGEEYSMDLHKLINLIIAIGIETLEGAGEMPDEPIDYELPEEKPRGLEALGHGETVEEASERMRRAITYVECHYPFKDEEG
jgi:hypothetical protein